MIVIPEENQALRTHLEAFTEDPKDETGALIMRELMESAAVLFVHSERQAGAEGEPPLQAGDLKLMEMEDGVPVQMIVAATLIDPDEINPDLADEGLYCRPLPAARLVQFCLERGIVAIILDPGHPTEVLIGPFGLNKPLKVAPLSAVLGEGPSAS